MKFSFKIKGIELSVQIDLLDIVNLFKRKK